MKDDKAIPFPPFGRRPKNLGSPGASGTQAPRHHPNGIPPVDESRRLHGLDEFPRVDNLGVKPEDIGEELRRLLNHDYIPAGEDKDWPAPQDMLREIIRRLDDGTHVPSGVVVILCDDADEKRVPTLPLYAAGFNPLELHGILAKILKGLP
jgi:hypothetical protein